MKSSKDIYFETMQKIKNNSRFDEGHRNVCVDLLGRVIKAETERERFDRLRG